MRGGAKVTDDDLRIVALIEGRPMLKARDLAEMLAVSGTTAWRILSRLETSGVTRQTTATRRDLAGGACECLAYLKAEWTNRAAIEAFDQALAVDAALWSGVRIAGNFDYRVQAFHPDVATANTWFRDLLSRPGISGGKLVFLKTLFDRPCFAAAVLGEHGIGQGLAGEVGGQIGSDDLVHAVEGLA